MNITSKLLRVIPSKFYPRILLLIFFAITGIFLELIGIGMIFPVIEVLLEGESQIFGKIDSYINIFFPNSLLDKQFLILLFLLCIFILKNIFLFFLHWFAVSFNVIFIKEVSTDLLNKYLNTEYILFTKKNSSEILRNVINECSVLNKKILLPILYVLMDILILFGIAVLLLLIEFKITLMIILFSASLVFIYYFLSKKYLYKLGLERQLFSQMVFKITQETFYGLKMIKVLKKENYFKDLFSKNMEKNLNVEKKGGLLIFVPKLITEIIFVCFFILILIFLLKNNANFTDILPQLSIYFIAAIRLIPCVNRMSLNVQTIKYGKPSIELLYNEFNLLKNDNKFISNKYKEVTKFDNIELKDVNFNYKEDKIILNQINLKISKGTIIGIIGKTGEGKSTLINIIIGLLKPDSGSIMLDDRLLETNLYKLKNFIGYIPQETFLIEGTILQNIIFTLEKNFDYDKNRLANAVRWSKLDNFLNKLQFGINSSVSERGSNLSGGQQQRISIARALYRDPKILILDESTNSLDEETEGEIMDDIRELKKEKSIIIISHRKSSLKNCDHIYEIKDKNLNKIK